ncbi:MAG: XrtA system polysaccharide chain length determinant [Cellvibrionaceae bacterium]
MDMLRLMRREVWIKRRLFAALYLVTSILFLVVGWNWPKVYTSSSAILVDQQNILRPLMQGTAVTTEVSDKAKLASEIIFSRRAMEEILVKSGWVDEPPTGLERERLAASIEGRTRIENAGQNIIRLSFSDQNPERAYHTARQLTDVFINHSLLAKQQESRDAYEFINGQVLQYHAKLQEAEEALKQFHSANFDARPGSQAEVNSRITELRRRKEATDLEIRELQIERQTLRKQLSGEAAITENLTREGQHRERLAELEQQLATLRLSYHDTYPDIVRLKNQIAAIEGAITDERRLAAAPRTLSEEEVAGVGEPGAQGANISGAAISSRLYQELRSRFSATETQLASLNERLDETNQLLAKEEDRIVRINDVEARLSELTRDYQVNQDIYQSLLRQRENARISMNIDQENQGLTFKIQEPPALPLTPKGIRFSHFMAAGLACSFLLPFGLIYGLTLVDQKVRSKTIVSDSLGLPILASVYHMNTPTEYNLNTFKKSIILAAILVSWVAYGYAAWLKVNG